ncbi:hypothetical protein JHK85_044028 [Glycine max]|nr:hypothetical protein JHK85_044028 [Glycine max]
MISARVARRTTIVSPVTTRVEWSQKVWHSSLSERASGISCVTTHSWDMTDAQTMTSLVWPAYPIQHNL